jgi:hypothetical protein
MIQTINYLQTQTIGFGELINIYRRSDNESTVFYWREETYVYLPYSTLDDFFIQNIGDAISHSASFIIYKGILKKSSAQPTDHHFSIEADYVNKHLYIDTFTSVGTPVVDTVINRTYLYYNNGPVFSDNAFNGPSPLVRDAIFASSWSPRYPNLFNINLYQSGASYILATSPMNNVLSMREFTALRFIYSLPAKYNNSTQVAPFNVYNGVPCGLSTLFLKGYPEFSIAESKKLKEVLSPSSVARAKIGTVITDDDGNRYIYARCNPGIVRFANTYVGKSFGEFTMWTLYPGITPESYNAVPLPTYMIESSIGVTRLINLRRVNNLDYCYFRII